nr:hypothetical protein [uncultured Flavobacterium sp.]
METIDLEYHRKNLVNNESVLIKDGLLVRTLSIDQDNSYVQYVSTVGSPVVKVKSYFNSTKLKSEGDMFFEFYTGIYRTFDESGKELSKINFDLKYPFLIEQLIEKMQLEFKVNLLKPFDSQGVLIAKVSRETLNEVPVYLITTRPTQNDPQMVRIIVIDGKTGKTLSDKVEFIHP